MIAEAVAAKDNTCQLHLVRTLKGKVKENIPVNCHLPSGGDWMTDFAGHTEINFWQWRSGRLGINGDCTVIPPAFEIGHKYLVLLGIKPDTKQFEEIASPKDKWLTFVEKQILEGEQ